MYVPWCPPMRAAAASTAPIWNFITPFGGAMFRWPCCMHLHIRGRESHDEFRASDC